MSIPGVLQLGRYLLSVSYGHLDLRWGNESQKLEKLQGEVRKGTLSKTIQLFSIIISVIAIKMKISVAKPIASINLEIQLLQQVKK